MVLIWSENYPNVLLMANKKDVYLAINMLDIVEGFFSFSQIER